MELPIDPDKEYTNDDILFYTKQIKANKFFCLICQIEEQKPKFDKYKLKCKHQYHTRCFRRYCFYKNKVLCPLCGDIQPFKEFKNYV